MDKVGRPRGLIRYASENNIEQGKKFVFTGRMKAYTGVLVLLIAFMAFLLITRSNLDAHITRSPGQLYAEMENNKLANFYQIKLVNKTNGDFPITLKLENINGELKMLGAESTVHINPLEHEKANFIVLVDRSQIKSRKTNLKIGIYSKGKKINTIGKGFLKYKPISREIKITVIVVVRIVSFLNCSAFPNETIQAPNGSTFISALLYLFAKDFTVSINGLFFAVSVAA